MSSRTIREFMSSDFVRVRPDIPVAGAPALMRSSNMRDLVVMDGDKLAGVLSQLDLYLIQTLTEADPEDAIVEEAMASHPYVVRPHVSLAEVARTMWKERHGSAVVMDEEQVVGIFTTADALHALFQVLVAEPGDGPEVEMTRKDVSPES